MKKNIVQIYDISLFKSGLGNHSFAHRSFPLFSKEQYSHCSLIRSLKKTKWAIALLSLFFSSFPKSDKKSDQIQTEGKAGHISAWLGKGPQFTWCNFWRDRRFTLCVISIKEKFISVFYTDKKVEEKSGLGNPTLW